MSDNNEKKQLTPEQQITEKCEATVAAIATLTKKIETLMRGNHELRPDTNYAPPEKSLKLAGQYQNEIQKAVDTAIQEIEEIAANNVEIRELASSHIETLSEYSQKTVENNKQVRDYKKGEVKEAFNETVEPTELPPANQTDKQDRFDFLSNKGKTVWERSPSEDFNKSAEKDKDDTEPDR